MFSLLIASLVFAAQPTITSTGSLGLNKVIEIDPTNRSVCTIRGKESPLTVHLNLEGLRWNDWPEFCEQLAKYLRVDKEPITRERPAETEKLLAGTGYFRAVACTATVAASEMTCAMAPEPMVRDVDIHGTLPFVLLEEDVRRQIFLRPGTVLDQEKGSLEKQEDRIRNYLERNGFFDSKVKITAAEGGSGAQPNEGMKIDTNIDAGPTVNVRKVEITGVPEKMREDIEDHFRHYWVFHVFPRRFQPDTFEDDVDGTTRRLQKKGYPEARITGAYELDLENGNVDVSLKVDLGPKMVLAFEGNKELDHDDLTDYSTFIASGSMDAVEVENTLAQFKEEYQKRGYYAVKITSNVRDEEDGKHITYRIEEGPSAKISSVMIQGNKAISSGDLDDAAELKTKGSGIFRRGRWVDAWIKRDMSAIRNAYRLHGFGVTTVDAVRTVKPDKTLQVLFDVHEGPRRTVGKVVFTGLPKDVEEKELRKRMRLLEKEPFVEGRLVSDRREVLTVLAAKGYPSAVINRRLKVPYKTAAGEAQFEYDIEPGERRLFGGFLVRGAFRTRDGVIADELSLDPGEPLDLLALSEAKQRLRALGVFSSVDLRPLDEWKGTKETWLLVEVTERDHKSLDAVFSYSTDDLFALGADFRDMNLFGRAIHLQLSARLSNASNLFTDTSIGHRDYLRGQVQAPHPFGLPFNTEYTAYYDFQDKTENQSDGTAGFTRRRVGVGAAVSRPLLTLDMCKKCPEITGRLGYELASVEGLDFIAGMPMPSQNEDIPNQTIARIVPSLSLRRLDSPVDPRKGYGADFRFEIANSALGGPLQDGTDFWRFLTSIEGYWTLGKPFEEEISATTTLGGPLVIAQNIAYGVGHPYGSDHELPITETFDYGGDLSLRGLSERASLNSVPNANYLLRGTTELRFYFLSTSIGSFQAAPFMDYGFVSRHVAQLLKDPTISVGGALRYITPVGPLSLAYGFPVVRADGIADHGRIHISFGYSF